MGIAAIAGAIADPSKLAALFGFQPVMIGPLTEPLIIDVLESESPDYGFEITRDPVESGSDITDHIETKPPSLTLDCVFTDMVFSLSSIMSGGVFSLLKTWRDKKDALYKMMNAKALINVSTPLGFYSNYLIESIAPQSTAQSGNCFRCRITVVHVDLVASDIGYIDPSLVASNLENVSPTDKKVKPAANKGPATTEPASSPAAGAGNGTADNYSDFGEPMPGE